MVFAILLLAFILLLVIIFFAFPMLSPIPYFPSNRKDLSMILKMLGLRHNQTVIDLGAGDGLVIFAAARDAYKRRLNTRFIAVEFNPILYLILHLRRLFHKNRKHIKILFANMFTMDYSKISNHRSQISVYLYISPWHLKRTVAAIQKHQKRFTVVSYMYPIPGRKETQKLKGKRVIYKYRYV